MLSYMAIDARLPGTDFSSLPPIITKHNIEYRTTSLILKFIVSLNTRLGPKPIHIRHTGDKHRR